MNVNCLKYVVDTCSFTALQRVYPIDIFPGAWDLIERLADAGVIGSVEDVFQELEANDDNIYRWAKKRKKIFLPLDESIQVNASKILSTHNTLLDLKKRKSSADVFLVATAIITSTTVVTEERPSGGPPKVKIPDVCKDYGVHCITLLDLFRAERLKLG